MDYKDLKREELRSICKSKGIRRASHMRKSQMIELLQAWRPDLPTLSEEDVAEEQALAALVIGPVADAKPQHRRPIKLLTALLCGNYPLLTAAVFA